MIVFFTLLCAVVAATHWGYYHRQPQPILTFTKNHVTVVVERSEVSAKRITVTATFTPQDGFHLYSTELPKDGIGGVGRPTRFELLATDSHIKLEPGMRVHPPLAQKAAFSKTVELSVFPAGPVHLTRNVNIEQTGLPTTVLAQFSYMSCHETLGCTIPVRDYERQLVLR